LSDLTEALAKTQGEHRQALNWFLANTGKAISWSDTKTQVNNGFRLVNQAKGIYKPHYTAYAPEHPPNSRRPYADKEVERRTDGSWVYPYFQENPDPSRRDREATNRGLVKCMEEWRPMGVLMQTKPKPGVEYAVLGLASVIEWQAGYFILGGFSSRGEANLKKGGRDAAYESPGRQTCLRSLAWKL